MSNLEAATRELARTSDEIKAIYHFTSSALRALQQRNRKLAYELISHALGNVSTVEGALNKVKNVLLADER